MTSSRSAAVFTRTYQYRTQTVNLQRLGGEVFRFDILHTPIPALIKSLDLGMGLEGKIVPVS